MWEDAGVMEGTTMTLEDFRDQIVRHEGLAEGLAQRWGEKARQNLKIFVTYFSS